MAKITGKTYDHRETLKSYGAKWNNDGKYWTVDDANAEKIKALNLAAVIVTMTGVAPTAEPVPFVPSFETNEAGTTVVGDDLTYHNAFATKNPRLFGGFSSLAAMADYVVNSTKRTLDSWKSHDPEFYGVSMVEALEFARRGWSQGADQANKIVDLFNAEHAERLTRTHSVAGGRVNVGRLMAGNPMHMSTRKRAPGRKIVTLFVANGMRALIEPQTALIRAACVAAIADLLEIAGYSCEVVGLSYTSLIIDPTFLSTLGEHHQIAVTLKGAGDPLNVADIAFGLGHPAMHRRLNFAVGNTFDHRIFGTNRAFDDNYPAPPNSFYIGPPTKDMQSAMFKAGFGIDERARTLFPFIVPDDLPVKLTA